VYLCSDEQWRREREQLGARERVGGGAAFDGREHRASDVREALAHELVRLLGNL